LESPSRDVTGAKRHAMQDMVAIGMMIEKALLLPCVDEFI
jgi:hypothetical protein